MYRRFIIDSDYRFVPLERARSGQLLSLPDEPRFTVVMPVFNHVGHIARSLETVLSQDYENLEVLVVDGGSTDGTLDVIRSYSTDKRLRWLSEPDEGTLSAILKGLKLATGHCFGVQLCSDTYEPCVVSKAAAAFLKDPTLFSVAGVCREVLADGSRGPYPPLAVDKPLYLTVEDILAFRFSDLQSAFFRREVLCAFGGFDERFSTCHTSFYLHFFLEGVRMGGRALVVPEIWGNYHRLPGAITETVLLHEDDVHKQRIMTCLAAVRVFGDVLTPEQVKYLRERRYLPDKIRQRLQDFQVDPYAA